MSLDAHYITTSIKIEQGLSNIEISYVQNNGSKPGYFVLMGFYKGKLYRRDMTYKEMFQLLAKGNK